MNALNSLLAVCDPIIGCISPPAYIPTGITSTGELTGVMTLINSLLRVVFVAAGLFAFFNLILAGFEFINSGGESKALTKAWGKIWQSIVGLLIIAVSFLVAAIIGILLFKDPFAILRPKL